MSVGLWWLCLSAGLGAEPGPAAKPEVVPLCAAEAWYKAAKEPEAAFEGVVEQNSGSGQLGPPVRFNPYRLSWIDSAGHPGGREVYVPGKAPLLAEYLGRRVRIVARAVDTEAGGKVYHELWAARLETLETVTATVPPAKVEGVYARCYWRPENSLHRGVRTYVFRDGGQLVSYLHVSGGGAAEAATDVLAKRLQVPAIDWQKQMVVSVAAGFGVREAERLTITRSAVRDGALVVNYRLESPPGGAKGLGLPAETVLVDRFEGEVRFVEDRDARGAEQPKP